MDIGYKLGICIDNADPKNHGRIRVVDYNAFKNELSVNRIKDKVAESSDGGLKYTLWSDGADESELIDEYVSEPFLPRHINMVPSEGQLVRLIVEPNGKKLYVGPISDSPTNLTSNYRNELTKNRTNTPNDISNKTYDTVISGINNEQINLGSNRVLVRLDHIDGNKRKTKYPIFQLSKFRRTLDYKETTKTVNKVKEVFIDYIIELDFNYSKKEALNSKNIQCNISIYDTLETITDEDNKKGLIKSNYNKYNNYTAGSIRNQYTVRHVLDFNDVESMSKAIEEILSAYNSKKIKFFNPESPETNQLNEVNGNIRLINRISSKPNKGGGVNDVLDTVLNLNNAVIRVLPSDLDRYLKPSQQLQDELFIPKTQPGDTLSLDYIRFNEFNQFIGKIRGYKESRFTGTQNLQSPITETIKTVNEEVSQKDITTSVMYADKFLFLSSINSPDYNDTEGMSNTTVSKFLSNISNDGSRDYETYGWVRGEKMLELINRLVDIVLRHGHSIGQVENSINEDTKKLLSGLTSELNKEIEGNKLNVETSIINHNLRIN